MDKDNIALIVAAGKGKRMGSEISKQFLTLKGKPILYYTIKAFSQCEKIDSIVLVLAKEYMDFTRKEIVEKYDFKKVKTLIEGGKERQQSVYNGLKAIDNCNIVAIHDGARPFVTTDIIEKGIIYAEEYGASACGVNPKDTIKVVNEQGFSVTTPDRNTLMAVQTPQCFKFDLIRQCHMKAEIEKFTATDDTMIVEHYGHRVYLYEGDYKNIKVTTPEDMLLGEEILDKL
ncbi:MAG: 2-C-methyl-D-erythritol 4-phosphate cytidylyltransferase [Clostridiales bacterium]|uniref:2-C-methyl-D-erythritol 4-phosphate cytidylyltransferase n=1 Tax=Clostridium sp. N3C TaxID=1776758 RepID=UPI00092E0F00|nr:2-C-methyl-D-erythritol 4-phosphate cytidylyltransferase [Clostridium sp. N3C]NLZ48132.1 2-C-methyl-D-erythritol 4-phosphate cytidylyltransferase [Clostridiales bacterium]SCN23219.1 2-C-methyl-D-erythritol 4-phosphate cytidylyltransferase 1 [Clostridium sp. N3C]